jgi:hypothetical protein
MPADADPLAFLLELNLACAAKEKAGRKSRRPVCRSPKPITPRSLRKIACASADHDADKSPSS